MQCPYHARRSHRQPRHGFVIKRTAVRVTVYTDDASVYPGLPDLFYRLEGVKHSVRKYVRNMAHTNGLESFWSMLKRGYIGVHHKMSSKHLDCYINEFASHHNIREQGTLTQMAGMVECMAGQGMVA